MQIRRSSGLVALAMVASTAAWLPTPAVAAGIDGYSIDIGASRSYSYPTDTPAAGLIDVDGSFHMQQSAALYEATALRQWDFYKGTDFDDMTRDLDLAKAVNPSNSLDRNDNTTWRCNNSPTGLEATGVAQPSTYSQRNYCDLVGWWADPDTGDWYGLVHNEFTPRPFGDGLHYDSIDYAVSTDKGRTWTIKGHAITSSHSTTRDDTSAFPKKTYKYGDGDPRLFVDAASGYFYVYYGSRIVPKGGVGGSNGGLAHVARAPMSKKMATGSWQKWYGGSWSQPGIGGQESNMEPVTATNPNGWTPVSKDYKATNDGNVDQQVASGLLPRKSDLFIMNIAYDAHLGLYIGEPEVVSGTAPQRFYVTDNLATQKWRLIGDSGSYVSGSWYRWMVDAGNRTDSMIVGKTFRSYCSIGCASSSGEYVPVTVTGSGPAAAPIDTSRTYQLRSAAGRYLAKSTSSSSATTAATAASEATSQWYFVALGDGSYRIQNVGSGQLLGVEATVAGRAWGSRPQVGGLAGGNAGAGQQWWVLPVKDTSGRATGALRIINRHSGLALAMSTSTSRSSEMAPVRAWTDASGTSIGAGRSEDEQLISATPVGAAPEILILENPGNQTTQQGGSVNLRLSATNTLNAPVTFSAAGLPQGLSISSDGRITGTASVGGVSQVTVTARTAGRTTSVSFSWSVDAVITGSHQLFVSGLALDDPGASKDNGVQMIVWDASTGANQRWAFTRQSDGSYQLRNESSQLCLDVENGSTQPGARIIQWSCGTGANQRWYVRNTSNGAAIVSVATGLSLTASGASRGAGIIQSNDSGQALQRWTIK